jgi:hypothetical protein
MRTLFPEQFKIHSKIHLKLQKVGSDCSEIERTFGMPAPHTPAFLAFRDLILNGLEDADRRRLAALFGTMTEPASDISPATMAAIRAFAALDPNDRRRVVRWFSTYVSRWGQVPVAASHRIPTPNAGSSPIQAPRRDDEP